MTRSCTASGCTARVTSTDWRRQSVRDVYLWVIKHSADLVIGGTIVAALVLVATWVLHAATRI